MEKVLILSVERMSRTTSSGDPMFNVYLSDDRTGISFDARFEELDTPCTVEIDIKEKGEYRGIMEYKYTLPKNYTVFDSSISPSDAKPHEIITGTPIKLNIAPISEQDNSDSPRLDQINDKTELWNARNMHEEIEQEEVQQEAFKTNQPKQEPVSESTPTLDTWENAISQAQKDVIAITGSERETLIEMAFAMQAMESNPRLKECDKASIVNAVVNIARTGITLNPALQLASLIPRKIKGKLKCILDFSYRGYVKILKDYGCVRDIQAMIVYEDEQFEEGISQTDPPVHKKYYAKTKEEDARRKILGVYCRVILPGDNLPFYTPLMPEWMIKEAEKMSVNSGDSESPWKKWRLDMYKKTKLKSDFKTLISGNPKETALASLSIESENEDYEKKTGSVRVKGSISKSRKAQIFGELPEAQQLGSLEFDKTEKVKKQKKSGK